MVKSYLKSLVKLVSAPKLEPEKPGDLGFTRVWLKHRTLKVGLDGFSQTFRVSVVGKHNLKSQVGLVSPGFQSWQILPGKQSLAWFSQLKGAYAAVVGKQTRKSEKSSLSKRFFTFALAMVLLYYVL